MSSPRVRIGDRTISYDAPTYFIADVASNHDGELARARRLVELSAEAGADAVKFQHFLAEDIVSDRGFRALGAQLSHQASWDKPVAEVYADYELKRAWTEELSTVAADCGIDFLSTPYDHSAVELLAPLVPAFKIGSGDITFTRLLEDVAGRGVPVLLAAGASTWDDVERAIEAVMRTNDQIVLMQCNTNYTGSTENFGYVNLRVLEAFAGRWPDVVLGLSDHTPGHATALGAIALGARVIEKHFTDDTTREGPDHGFSMDQRTWREMINQSRRLESALGDGIKRVEANELETAVVQRRALRAAADLPEGRSLDESDLVALRPAPEGSLGPFMIAALAGRRLCRDIAKGQAILASDVDPPL